MIVPQKKKNTVYFFVPRTCSTPVERNITVSFLYQEDDRILPFQIKPIISNISDITLYPGQMMYEIKIIAKDVGEVLIHMNSSATDELE